MPKSNRRVMRAQKKHKEKPSLWTKFIFLILFIFCFFIFLKLTTRYWSGDDKVAIAFKNDGGDVGVSILDPRLDDFTTLIIPGDTQVEVAENYGTLRIKNVWQLGINEGKKGRLLSESISRNFRFPVSLWSDSDAMSLKEGNFFTILKFVMIPKSTNIPFGDRVFIGLFALQSGTANKSQIDLGKSQYLTKQKLSDGQIGYVLAGKISEHLQVYFSDNEIAESSARVSIVDGTGKFGIAQIVGEILEVMGGKVVSIDKNNNLSDIDCLVSGKDKKIVKKISTLFSCAKQEVNVDTDLQITLGVKFANRF